MRILILSDLHGNTWALQAVLQAAGQVDAVLFAGDAVKSLPLYAVWAADGTRFALVHGSLRDPLYDYRPNPKAGDEALLEAAQTLRAEVVVFGHTYLPSVRRIGEKLFVNPGSAGQPLDRDPRASFALYEDGRARLERVEYDLKGLLQPLEAMPLDPGRKEELRLLYPEAR
ncbi:metallophosphoesterase family protein [Thermus thermamylovorans]|uniref:Metallophosphoesterase n=1 Tax=Thermus thermamylovorans TaxID=2509362 RepID=A0A4Q9AXV0_9DEIN|nr:metallophosphoesterase family protein [Thermus thermamylovorans]TBH16539.1 metallophosphoesterase [Thermus thermamylovorans]